MNKNLNTITSRYTVPPSVIDYERINRSFTLAKEEVMRISAIVYNIFNEILDAVLTSLLDRIPEKEDYQRLEIGIPAMNPNTRFIRFDGNPIGVISLEEKIGFDADGIFNPTLVFRFVPDKTYREDMHGKKY